MATIRQIRLSADAAVAEDLDTVTVTYSLETIRHAHFGFAGSPEGHAVLNWAYLDTMRLQGRTARSTKSPQVTFRITTAERDALAYQVARGTKLANDAIAARYAK